RIWSPRASCGCLTRSMTSIEYRPFRCSSQSFFKFARADIDLEVCPATYSLNSQKSGAVAVLAMFPPSLLTAAGASAIPGGHGLGDAGGLLPAESHRHPVSRLSLHARTFLAGPIPNVTGDRLGFGPQRDHLGLEGLPPGQEG